MSYRQYNVLLRYVFISILLLSNFISAEKVYKFRYNDIPEKLNGTVVSVMDKSVALDKYIIVGDSADSGNALGVASVIFIIDHTGSMGQAWTDATGKRWEVANDLTDLINSRSPNSEIAFAVFGKGLFFNLSDETLFAPSPPSGFGAYLPLLKLNERYNSSAFGAGTGYQILKKFMTHQLNTNSISWLASHPSADAQNHLATNIDLAMKTGKAALANARYPKANRYIILITDGQQEGAGTNEYLQGIETPTTFTMFIGTLPTTIVTMTNNIKINGYSSSNPSSAAWSLTASNLLTTALTNIIPTIFQRLRFVPSQLAVNSTVSTAWDKTGFSFPDLFPLIAQNTPFNYEIKYKIYKDSGTTSTFVKDTVVNVKYTAKIDPGPSTPKVNHFWWDRAFKFFKNGTEIFAITESSGDVECWFYVDSGTANYQYAAVNISINNTATNPQDNETASTVKQGNYFTATIKHALGAASPGDNTLQHSGTDNLVVTFRNPKLPLDTLKAMIPFQSNDVVTLSRGTYFDNNADGLADSIAVEFAGVSIKNSVTEILKKLQLPAWRNFTVITPTPYDNTIGLSVNQGLQQPVTAVTKEDTIKITDTVTLTGGVKLPPGAVWVVDKMAPVVVKASLVDSQKVGARDELTVTLSEPVQNVTAVKPFYFYVKANNTRYTAMLTQLNLTQAVALFSVDALQGALQVTDGDSIHVKYDEATGVTVVDAPDNRQANPANIKRPISVTVISDQINLQIHKATYFDLTGNGTVDSIAILISGKDVEKYSPKVAPLITLPSFRVLSVSTTVAHAGGLALSTSEAGPLTTYITDKDSLIIDKEYDLGDNVKLLKSRIAFTDGIAPVLMSASLRRFTAAGRTDSLQTVFSEAVETITPEKPFALFSKPNGFAQYSIFLKAVSQSGSAALFEVIAPYTTEPVSGDSICISWTAGSNVVDKAGNNQVHPKNIRRELSVSTIKGLVLKQATYFDTDARGDIDRIALSFSEEVKEAYTDIIKEQLQLPAYRKLLINAVTVQSSSMILDVAEKSDLCKTDVSAQDYVQIAKQIQLDSSLMLEAKAVQCIDSMAPVLVSATLVDSLQETSADVLTIIFSEPVPSPLPSSEPFWFYHAQQTFPSYSIELASPVIANTAVIYQVVNKQICNSVKSNDSVRIAYVQGSLQGIKDQQAIIQMNQKNILRPLVVRRISAPFVLEFKATLLDSGNPVIIPANLAGVKEIQQMLGSMSVSKAVVMVMAVEPNPRNNLNTAYQKIEAWVDLYDALGNLVQSGLKMYFDTDNKRCIYFWDGHNLSGRSVGGGTYCALVDARVIDVTKRAGTSTPSYSARILKGFVGVKK